MTVFNKDSISSHESGVATRRRTYVHNRPTGTFDSSSKTSTLRHLRDLLEIGGRSVSLPPPSCPRTAGPTTNSGELMVDIIKRKSTRSRSRSRSTIREKESKMEIKIKKSVCASGFFDASKHSPFFTIEFDVLHARRGKG